MPIRPHEATINPIAAIHAGLPAISAAEQIAIPDAAAKGQGDAPKKLAVMRLRRPKALSPDEVSEGVHPPHDGELQWKVVLRRNLGEGAVVGEALAGLGALKTALDLARGLKDINDATIRAHAVVDLLQALIAAHEHQQTLLKRIDALEAELARREAWKREKEGYELKGIGGGAVAYMKKPAERGESAPHWVCPTCFAKSEIALFQPTGALFRGLTVFRCNGCQANISVPGHPSW